MLGRCVTTEIGLSVVRLPYSSLSGADLDTYPLPGDNRGLDTNFVVTVFDHNTELGSSSVAT
ncbi:hypothetical protein F2Q69_00035633 [Brassica cretica]|uniref:Uncharacterized protein n=1 Tax=Brassica cretica TaxID=69181 RepID=A0A8S9SCV0_BRACR|nr:hypothetical protein F2Q69_00035633 [Brassica cretica]